MLRTRILESFERLRHPQVTPGHGLVTGPPLYFTSRRFS